MSALTIHDIPALIRSNKDIYPLLRRAFEVRQYHPIVSYYCFFCALERILAARLHTLSPEMELFTTALLDNTESTKNSDDELLSKVVHDRILLLTVVVSFTYALVNKCFVAVQSYNAQSSKAVVVDQIRASLTFLSVVDYMLQDAEEDADWKALCGAAVSSKTQFQVMNKKKSKLLKAQLVRLLKDEMAYDGRIEDDALELELMNLKLVEATADPTKTAAITSVDSGTDNDLTSKSLVDNSNNDTSAASQPQRLAMPLVPTDLEHIEDFKSPDTNRQNFPTCSPELERNSENTRPNGELRASPAPVSRLNLAVIADRADNVRKIQKHAKFAVSALNYDDFKTAERELEQSLELLKQLMA